MRVLVTGASGSGATTLGRALSVRLSGSFLDADDYYWIPTDPPYEEKRDPAARLQLILVDLRKVSSAVVAGCVRNWGDELEDSFSLKELTHLKLNSPTVSGAPKAHGSP
jgi:Adenylate kinase and related kinases